MPVYVKCITYVCAYFIDLVWVEKWTYFDIQGWRKDKSKSIDFPSFA